MKIEELQNKEKYLSNDRDIISKKFNELKYDFDIEKDNFNKAHQDLKICSKELEDQKSLTSSISILKEKEISDISKCMNDNTKLLNDKIIEKENEHNLTLN